MPLEHKNYVDEKINTVEDLHRQLNFHEPDPYDWVDGDGPGVYNSYTDLSIDYAFNEGELLDEMREYIDSTYDAHYSQSQYQSTEIIEDMGHGMGFALGNVIKYCQRYGKKQGYNRADLMKVIHYGLIALAMHDRENALPAPDEIVNY